MKKFREYLNKPTKRPDEIADKFDVGLDHIEAQLKIGISVEHEHTSNSSIAREIALDHLDEDPNYYTKLKKMEKEN